jgi:hypothetical protein
VVFIFEIFLLVVDEHQVPSMCFEFVAVRFVGSGPQYVLAQNMSLEVQGCYMPG